MRPSTALMSQYKIAQPNYVSRLTINAASAISLLPILFEGAKINKFFLCSVVSANICSGKTTLSGTCFTRMTANKLDKFRIKFRPASFGGYILKLCKIISFALQLRLFSYLCILYFEYCRRVRVNVFLGKSYKYRRNVAQFRFDKGRSCCERHNLCVDVSMKLFRCEKNAIDRI